MKDFPFFATEFGVAGLELREIPYRGEAYIRIREVVPGKLGQLVEECASFCRMAGAERVYAQGHPELSEWPLHTAVLEMRGTAWVDERKLACLFPVTEETVSQWRQLCNEAMGSVDNAATLEARDEEHILREPGAYFVHDNGRLLGIGWLKDGELLALAAVEKGAGERVMHTMMSLIEGEPVRLDVASTNTRAIRLYERLGFVTVGEQSRWYVV
ncbi:MAG: hypothetical protein SPI15_03380 [Candidatus Faecousia sp.]|nr:hypothetical protein [Candidatus Faecousia sp.]